MLGGAARVEVELGLEVPAVVARSAGSVKTLSRIESPARIVIAAPAPA
jgi:hypothetical protein